MPHARRRPLLAGLALALAAAGAAPSAAAAAPARTADLSVLSVRASADRVTVGSQLTVTDVTANRGGRRAAASQTTFLLSADRKRSAQDVVLGPGRRARALSARRTSRASTALTIPASVRPGRYFVLACADGAGRVAERREGDNCRASAAVIVVAPPVPAPPRPVGTALLTHVTPLPPGNDVAPLPPQASLCDDIAPTLELEPATVLEGETAVITVTLSPERRCTPRTFDWAATAQTATTPGDYAAAAGDVTFPVGEKTATIEIPTVADAVDEPDETFMVSIPGHISRFGAPAEAMVTVTD